MSKKNIALWVVQGLLALTFVGAGIWKLATPLPKLAAMIPWAGQVSPGFLYFTAAADIAGGVGILLPRVDVLAALGCALLQASAIVFHVTRGEAVNTPFNFLLVALSLFVAWKRRR